MRLPVALLSLIFVAAAGAQTPNATVLSSRPSLTLTREQAEQLALKSNPNISVSKLLALAQHQVVREVRSRELPDLQGSLAAVQSNDNANRISGIGLTASRTIRHVGTGVELSQLITDFGRTSNLVASSRYSERAQIAYAQATADDIVLATDQAFFNALEAQATLRVASQTEAARKTVRDQITALTNSNLKSTLDQSFAEVALSQAQMLVLDAQNNLDASFAQLNQIIGLGRTDGFTLLDDTTPLPPPPPPDSASLVSAALQHRPDLAAVQDSQQAAEKFRLAQRDQMLPTLGALGTVGATPIGDTQDFPEKWYGAVGLSIDVPIFNGFRYSADAQEAALRARAAGERVRDLHDRITRDVTTSALSANTAYKRVIVTEQLLKQSNLALSLAQTRYQLGLSSIVELSQAQLQQTEAAIADANARYQYRFAISALNFQTGMQP
jgi:outer membrane protein